MKITKQLNNSICILALKKIRGMDVNKIYDLCHKYPTTVKIDMLFKPLLGIKGKGNNQSNLLYRIFKINCGLITWKECKQQAEKIIISTIKSGVKIISIIDKDFPKNIQNTKFKQKCILLYYKGDISIANSKCVAIIGARKPPACIESKVLAWTSSIAYQLAIKKYTVVSGLAIGCDTAGHIGCLNADGKTIAFLPGNLNSIYPKVNQELANRIVKNGGCLISEKGIYDKISKNGFIDRDRLQAMISDFIIVGYADNKCSTMFAVNNALKNSLPIYQSKFSKIKLNGQIKIWNMNL